MVQLGSLRDCSFTLWNQLKILEKVLERCGKFENVAVHALISEIMLNKKTLVFRKFEFLKKKKFFYVSDA